MVNYDYNLSFRSTPPTYFYIDTTLNGRIDIKITGLNYNPFFNSDNSLFYLKVITDIFSSNFPGINKIPGTGRVTADTVYSQDSNRGN